MKSQTRNYGIDLLRIVSMLMVCMTHILSQGGVQGALEFGSSCYKTSIFLSALSYGAVNCYGIISGYVGVEANIRYRSIIKLWLQAAFYSVGITLLFVVGGADGVGRGDLLLAVRPVLSYQYWYFTGYFCLFFFMPFLNKMIDAAGEKGRLQMLLLILFFFSFLQTCGWQMFYTNDGYSFLWLMLLYLMGGCMRKISLVEKIPGWVCALTYFAGAAVAQAGDGHWITYISPAILLGSLAIVSLFSKMKFSRRMSAWIGRAAPLAFGVYLIHVHPLVFQHVLKDRFAFLSEWANVPKFILGIAGCSLLLFALCMGIEAVRKYLFKWMRMDLICEKLEELLMYIEKKVYNKLLGKECENV